MIKRSVGRILAGVGVCAVVLGLSVAGSPSSAAPAAPVADFPHLVLTPGGSGRTDFVAVRNAGATVTLHDVTVTVNTAGVSRFAKVERFLGNEGCTTTATGFACKLGEQRLTDGYEPLLSLWVTSLQSAVPGDSGTLTSTVTSREYGSSVRRSTVTTAEAVSFEPGGYLDMTVKPGQTVKLPFTLRNTGTRPVTSTYMWFFREAMFTFPQSFRNCQYGKVRVFCRFDDDIPVGATVRLSEPLKVTVRQQVPAPGVIGHDVNWATTADVQNEWEDFRTEKPKAGTGGKLRLVVSSGAAPVPGGPEVPQSTGSSVSFPRQSSFMTVSGRNVADLTAVGATARGKVRKTVSVSVGAKNLGPAFVFGVQRPAAKVVVKRPKGTTVVGVPAGCLPLVDGKAVKRQDPRGAAEYLCTTTVNPFEVGQRITWRFQLRIDKKGTLTGSVGVLPSTVDGKRGNDTAPLRVNPPKR